MKTFRVQESQVVGAPPHVVYAILADYEKGHPSILPKPAFESLTVEKGGKGAGTHVRVVMKVMGTRTTLRMRVTEPEPGRVLQEEDDAGTLTRFTVTPIEGGARSRVEILTEWKRKPGLRGLVEKMVNPRVARPLYRKELALLDERARGMA